MLRRFLTEVKIAFAVLFPNLLYLYLRAYLAPTKLYPLNPFNLLDPGIYPATGSAFIDQFGIFSIFFLVGCVLLIRRKQYFAVLFFALVLVSTLLFFAMYSELFVGYSRF